MTQENYPGEHTFTTDVLSIFFNEPQETSLEGFWFSLLYAILEGASQHLE
jgi:hypothetical protein